MMKQYESVPYKIAAMPMTRSQYNAYRDWVMPENEVDMEQEGYLVEFFNGGTPNHSDHSGRISWIPASSFIMRFKLCKK